MRSTNQVAKILGLTTASLSRYIKAGKIPSPRKVSSGGITIHLWSDQDIERVRQLLPKIKNGRKTRYLKSKKSEASSQKSVGPNAKPKTKKKH